MNSTMLSATDAFFVAYQETSGVLMQLGVEVEVKGRITRSDLEQVLLHIVRRWPPLGQTLRRRLFGLAWEGECRVNEMLTVTETREALAEWRNRPLNPFVEPPVQLLWLAEGDRNLFAFRAHHAVVDGEGFFAVCVEGIRKLVEILRPQMNADERGSDLYSSAPIRGQNPKRQLKLRDALETVQQMRKAARADRSAKLATRSCTPGHTAIVERKLNQTEFRELQQQATELGMPAGWLCASAWMKAIHAWNISRGVNSTSLISLEVPVSLRRRRDTPVRIGNWISPLTLYGDASQSLEDLAQDLKQQLSRAVRQKSHLALPMVSGPAKFLPWPLFRRLAASPELTGFATSHYAWFEQAQTLHDDVLRLSGGALQLVDQQIYPPVCLHMGAALSVLAWPEHAQLFLTYRLTALSSVEAQRLLDLMVQELGQRRMSRQQVAV